jgi:tRNA (guanine-N7-)-methyltransferase
MPSKIEKFIELAKLPNIVQHTDKDAREKLSAFLSQKKKTIVELACGGGDYTIAMAKMFPDKNFIGIDIQGERLWFGSKTASENKLDNVLFFRVHIHRLLEFFDPSSIDEIWITFPDPFPKKKRYIKKRLTSPVFLDIYKKLVKPSGVINLKTDDKQLFDYSKETVTEFDGTIISDMSDIYTKKKLGPLLEIKTYFEYKHLESNKKINYLRFKLGQ